MLRGTGRRCPGGGRRCKARRPVHHLPARVRVPDRDARRPSESSRRALRWLSVRAARAAAGVRTGRRRGRCDDRGVGVRAAWARGARPTRWLLSGCVLGPSSAATLPRTRCAWASSGLLLRGAGRLLVHRQRPGHAGQWGCRSQPEQGVVRARSPSVLARCRRDVLRARASGSSGLLCHGRHAAAARRDVLLEPLSLRRRPRTE